MPTGRNLPFVTLLALLALLSVGCTPMATPSPAGTAAPLAARSPATSDTAVNPAPPSGSPASAASPTGAASPVIASSPGPIARPASTASLTPAESSEVEAFYHGKTVHIVVGFGAGGAYDLYARLTQKLLGHHLPGAPTVIVENMTGAGSLTAANHLAEAAAKDGTVIGTFGAAVVLQQAVGASGGAVKFEPGSLPWLGSPAVITDQCMVKSATGIDSLDKLIASPKGVVFGASALGNNTAVLPSVMKYYLNDKLKVVTGYDGIAAIKVAVERGELDAACGSWEGLRASYAEWLQASPPYAKVLVKARPDPEQQLREVPDLGSRLPSEEAKQVLAMAEAPSAAGFVFATTPGVPETRLKALRLAVLETWQDPEFSADAQRANLAVAPQDAATVARALADITSASPELLQKTKEVLGIQ